jgi:putative hydrolase of the HAD superfamily
MRTATGVAAVLVDYGGVLTNPIEESLVTFAGRNGLTARQITEAVAAVSRREGYPLMGALETGLVTEVEVARKVSVELTRATGRPVEIAEYREQWFGCRVPNHAFLGYLPSLRERGYLLGLLTNNVREWRTSWRAGVPVPLFDCVVDSSAEGTRKPDQAFYRIALDRLAELGLPPRACLMVDDVAENCAAAAEAGMRAVRFTTTQEAITAIERELRS